MIMNDMAYKFFDERCPPHGTAGYSYLFAAMAVAAFITIIGFLRKPNIHRILWPVIALAGFLVSMLSTNNSVGYIAAMMCWAGMGGCAISGFFAFSFVLNNSERFASISIVVLNMGLNVFLYETPGYPLYQYILLVFTLIIMVASVFSFKPADFKFASPKDNKKTDIPKGTYSLSFCVLNFLLITIIGDDALIRIVGEGSVYRFIFGGGIVAAVMFCVVVQLLFRSSIWHVWNIFLFLSLMGYGMAIFSGTDFISYAGYALYGVGVGFGNYALFYLSGGLFKKYMDIKFFLRMVFLFCLISLIGTFITGIFYNIDAQAYGIYVLVFMVVLSFIHMLLAPIHAKHLFNEDWIDDYHNFDMALITEQINKTDALSGFGLTPREKEVCALLLKAHTLRQIAGDLGIAYSTVNVHYTNLYRKLGINSRVELLVKFGITVSKKEK